MAEAFLISPLLKVVIENLASLAKEEIVAFLGASKQLEALSGTLSTIRAVLKDAERKQENSEAVREWLQQLREVVYDADDILDEFASKALQHKIQTSNRKQVCNSFIWTTKMVLFKHDMAGKIKEMRRRIDDIAKNRHDLHLVDVDVDGGTQFENRKGRETSSLVDKSRVFGREEERKVLVDLLVSDKVCVKNVSVISIVGMGGIGKTTLAQLVYDDEVVKENFDLRMWVYASQDFDVKRLTRAIVTCHENSQTCTSEELDPLQNLLKRILVGKKFLLVLDDVWNEDCTNWNTFRVPLTFGAKGSVVMVTTRQEKVSRMIDTIPSFKLGGLSENDCWLLFKLRAFGEENPDLHPRLKEIGRKIVNKCRGLPLAVQALGGVLAYKRDESEWINVFQSEIWDLPENSDKILPVLKLSYNYLPSHLRQCFVYCSLFPKNYQFEKTKLIHLWMGEGFILPEGRKELEDIGLEYFNELLLMSFFQYSHENKGKSIYEMHDLIHDLAQFISNGLHFRNEVDQFCVNYKKTRHLSINSTLGIEKPNIFQGIYKAKRLRTILLLHIGFTACSIPQDMFLRLRFLRVLDLSDNTCINNLPDSIGKLKHLRYLSLSSTHIETLPESVSTLWNLQTLNLKKCHGLRRLPKDMKNLINLRHLSLGNHDTLLPPGIGALTSLQTLNCFHVGKTSSCGIEELKDLTKLHGKIHISDLENVVNLQAAREADLKNKQHLHRLILQWSSYGNDERVLEQLQPHINIKTLLICGYGGTSFPRWIGDSQFSNLIDLELSLCRQCKFLPPIGQLPSLKYLSICYLDGVEQVGREFYGEGNINGFPSLEKLRVLGMINLEEWYGAIEEGDFPCLHEITIQRCPKLWALPKGLQNLTSLQNFTIECFSQLQSLQELPTALKCINISNCDKLISLPNCLENLTSLRHLKIKDCAQLTNFPDDMILPALEDFDIIDCFSLNSLPIKLKAFTSLRRLKIINCYQLASLPNDGLPIALDYFGAFGCPLLDKGCKKGGQDWPKIAHIPMVRSKYTKQLKDLISLLSFVYVCILRMKMSPKHSNSTMIKVE